MSEERWSRPVPPRRSAPEGSGRAAGGSGGPGGSGSGGPGGGGRRRAGAPEFGPAELAAALHDSVSVIGASGPPRAGLTRIRKRAKARQRRRTAMAGSAGVLVLAVAVSVVTGNSFDIVPVLTGVVGLGGTHSSSGDDGGAPLGGGGRVRTVRPPADALGRKGPAIGPLGPTAGAVPTALAAAGVPVCAAADLTTVTTVDTVISGVSYGHVEATAQRACAVAGPPVLQVQNAAGTAAGTVVILPHAPTDGSRLPEVATWGAVLKLTAGQAFDFQFAWAPDGCPAGTGGGASSSAAQTRRPGPASTATGGAPGTRPSQSPGSAYTLSYLIAGRTPTEPVDLAASCGATVYVTDVYARGAYPLPTAPVAPSTEPSASVAPSTTPGPPSAPASSESAQSGGTAVTPSGSAGSGSAAPGASPAGSAAPTPGPGQPSTS